MSTSHVNIRIVMRLLYAKNINLVIADRKLEVGHSTLEMVRHYVNLASSHIAIQHQKYSPLDRLNLRKL